MKYVLSLGAFFFLFSNYAQKIDTAPLDAYWRLVEPLKHGDSLSLIKWQEFLKIEANQVYIENQGFDQAYLERLRKNIQFVYMPKHDSLLNARLEARKKDPNAHWLTYKVYQYKANEEALKQYAAKIKEPSYLDSIYKATWQWLPKHLQKRDTSVVIHLLGIENDAIAGNGTIIFTAWTAFCQDRLKMGIIGGHEMHHVLRKPVEFKNVSKKDEGLMYILNSILNEGLADMVDKKYELRHENELPYEYQFKDFLLLQADSIVKQIDSSILIMASTQGKDFKTEKYYRNLIRWTSGHCPGFYMADIIVRNGFKKELVEHAQDPFYFIFLYNKAATADPKKPAVLSPASLAYIQLLQKKYWTAKKQPG